MSNVEEINEIINILTKIDGVGYKLASRIAYKFVLDYDVLAKRLIDVLYSANKKLSKCRYCGSIASLNMYDKIPICSICKDKNRDSSKLLIVENPFLVTIFESANFYNGYYYILGGLLSPIDGISPSNLNLDSLVGRINSDYFGSFVDEIVFGFTDSIESQITISYIKNYLLEYYKDLNLKFFKLASGIPYGADIESISAKSLVDSLKNKTLID